jgi:hypothetical protein
MLTITPLDIPNLPPVPELLKPRPLRPVRLTDCMLRWHLTHQLVYFSVVEYIGHDQHYPIGVIVTSPGQHYAEARFHLKGLPLVPHTQRWRMVHSFTANIVQCPPDTLATLKALICSLSHADSLRNPAREAGVLAFRPIQAMLVDPANLLEKLYEQEILMGKTVELDEELAEAIVEEELAGEFTGSKPMPSNGAKAPSICQFIGSMVRHMKPAEAETALLLLAEQEDTTSYDVSVQIMKHVTRQINSKPISPEQLERILAAWERVPRW